MAKKKDFIELQKQFPLGEMKFHNDGFWRLQDLSKKYGEGYYAIGFLLPGYCGEHQAHPEIIFHFAEDGTAIPDRLYDYAATPPKIIDYKQGTADELESELQKLFERFHELALEMPK